MSEIVSVPMLLWCPACGEHHTHACQNCGMVWGPTIVPTVGGERPPEADAMAEDWGCANEARERAERAEARVVELEGALRGVEDALRVEKARVVKLRAVAEVAVKLRAVVEVATELLAHYWERGARPDRCAEALRDALDALGDRMAKATQDGKGAT